jgi:hypothetical protein
VKHKEGEEAPIRKINGDRAKSSMPALTTIFKQFAEINHFTFSISYMGLNHNLFLGSCYLGAVSFLSTSYLRYSYGIDTA